MEQRLDSEMQNKKPQVKKYSNVIQFIRDTFNYRKSIDPKFTLDIWSAELGFKSRSFMYMVYSGKRQLTPKFIEIFAKSVQLTASETKHMLLLSYYQKAKSMAQKSIYLDKIFENLETSESIIALKDHAKFLSDVSLPLIKLVLAFDDVRIGESELSALLNIDAKTLRTSLATLEKLGLASCSSLENQSEKVWASKVKTFVVPDDGKNQSIDLYHQSTLEEAINVLQSDVLQRRYRTIFFAMDEAKHPEMLEEIEFFLTKLKNKYGSGNLDGKKVMKLNLQAYPVTETFKK